MKRIFVLLFALILTSVVGYSQALTSTSSTPAQNQKGNGTAYAGYSLGMLNTGISGVSMNASGLQMGTSANFTDSVAAEFDVSAYFLRISGGGTVVDTSFLAGPRFNYKLAFVHTLVGIDHVSYTGYNKSIGNAFTVALGGGIQLPVSPHWAIRTSVDYAPMFSGGKVDSIRLGGGVVYVFGGSRKS